MTQVKISYKNSAFGILRWISKRIAIPNLFGEKLINISVDSSSTANIAAPIGYVSDDGIGWWASDYTKNEGHFYCVDFKTFKISISGCILTMSLQHFHKIFNITGSNDGESWYPIKEAKFTSKPQSCIQPIYFDFPVNYRFYNISVNGARHDGNYELSLGALDFYGSILWDIGCTCKRNAKTLINVYFILTYLFS